MPFVKPSKIKIIIFFCIILLGVFVIIFCFSSGKNSETGALDLEKAKAMPYEELIEKAQTIARQETDSSFLALNYDRVRILANEAELFVKFENSVEFRPLNTVMLYSVSVWLSPKVKVGKRAEPNPSNLVIPVNPPLYVRADYDQTVAEILGVINEDGDLPSIELPLKTAENVVITEFPAYYEIYYETASQKYWITADKSPMRVVNYMFNEREEQSTKVYTQIN